MSTAVLTKEPEQLVLELTEKERSQLNRCEAVIEAGRKTFIEVGNAMLTIRDNRLYREKHKTFEEYCGRRWQIGKSTAYRMMEAAEVVSNIQDGGSESVPDNQAQAAALAALEPQEQREAWDKAVETAPDGKVTAEHVKTVVAERLGWPTPERIEVTESEIQAACDSNSCDRVPSAIGRNHKPGVMRNTFEFQGRLYVAMSSRWASDCTSAECWRLIPAELFEDGPTREHHGYSNEERRLSYHGLVMTRNGKRFALQGPPVVFFYNKPLKPESADSTETPAHPAQSPASEPERVSAAAVAPPLVDSVDVVILPKEPESRVIPEELWARLVPLAEYFRFPTVIAFIEDRAAIAEMLVTKNGTGA